MTKAGLLVYNDKTMKTLSGRQEPETSSSSLDIEVKTARQNRRKYGRCFQRVMSGLERGGSLRLLTLTSTTTEKEVVQKAFRAFSMALRRRGVMKDYLRVPEITKAGKIHLHVIYRGTYLEQGILSSMWLKYSGASVVFIQRVYRERGCASYLAKYMAKARENAGNYSWSWGWVWRGFCRDWRSLKKVAKLWGQDLTWVLSCWRYCLTELGYFDWSVVLRWTGT